jgi:trigger factor
MATNISTEVKTEENSIVSVKVTVPKEKVEEELSTTINEYTKKVNLPGFRKGKAPKNMVYKKYKRDIEVESIEKILNDSVKEIIQEEDLKIYSRPQITDMDSKLSKEKDFNFEFRVEVLPSVELPEYKGVEFKKVTYTYTDEDVEERLKEIQQNESMVVDKEDAPIQEKDLVSISYDFFLIGKTDEEPENHTKLTIGEEPQEEWLKPIHQDLPGKSAGYEATYNVDIPRDYSNDKLAGKPGKVYIKVDKVEAMDIPEIDDDLAKDLDFDNLDALKVDVNKNLQEDCNNLSRDANAQNILDKIIQEAKFDIPESLINDETKHQKDSFLRMFGGDPQEIEQYLKQSDTKGQFEKRFRENAQDLIKRELVTDRIINQEELTASDDEINKQIEQYAEKYNTTTEKIKEEFEKNDVMFMITRGIEIEKLNDFLIECGQPTEEEEKTLAQLKEERQHHHEHDHDHEHKDEEETAGEESPAKEKDEEEKN